MIGPCARASTAVGWATRGGLLRPAAAAARLRDGKWWRSQKRGFAMSKALKHMQATVKDIPIENVRNFVIVAHVDHGKSTLCDRLLQLTGIVEMGSKQNQVLDSLPTERERGITIKAQTCSMLVNRGGKTYLLNLIDTPGHVDFNYEVSRSLRACQGAILLVDALQGIQAQTVSTFYSAFVADCTIIPALNKIDMPGAICEEIKKDLEVVLDMRKEDVHEVSAKTGVNVPKLVDAVIEKIPPPVGDPNKPFRALIFDMVYDKTKGVVFHVKVEDGQVSKRDKLVAHHAKLGVTPSEVGLLAMGLVPTETLMAGQVGYIVVGKKNIRSFRIGETLYVEKKPVEPFEGFRPARQMVWAGVYPELISDGEKLESAVQQLLMQDASVEAKREMSNALGFGFRCGFLGLLHMDVFKQRLESEFGMRIIITTPTVPYKMRLKNGTETEIATIEDFPAFPDLPPEKVWEPIIEGTIICMQEHLSNLTRLCLERRGLQTDLDFLEGGRIMIKYKLPLAEIVEGKFFAAVQELSSGYATFDYEHQGYRESDIVKVQVALNGDVVDEMSFLCLRDLAQDKAQAWCAKLQQLIPRQMFEIRIQARIGSKPIAKSVVKAVRKQVIRDSFLGKGDPSRIEKLLQRQKDGKARMREISNVQVPPEVFVEIMRI